MAYWLLSNDYKNEKANYDKYLNKSRLVRSLAKIFLYLIAGGFLLALLGDLLNIEITSIWEPAFTINYIFTAIVSTFLVGGFVGALIFGKMHDNIKEECFFDDIKIDFIHIYEALLSYEEYLLHQIPVDKNDAIEHFDQSLKIIKEWDIGNVPFITNMYETQIDYLQNKLRGVLLHQLNSDDENKIRNAKTLLFMLGDFLLHNNEEKLNDLYNNATTYEDEEVEIWEISTKDKISIYIQNHQVISQVVFTAILLTGLYYLGYKMDVMIKEMMPWFIALLPSSLLIFNWIKETVFQIEK